MVFVEFVVWEDSSSESFSVDKSSVPSSSCWVSPVYD